MTGEVVLLLYLCFIITVTDAHLTAHSKTVYTHAWQKQTNDKPRQITHSKYSLHTGKKIQFLIICKYFVFLETCEIVVIVFHYIKKSKYTDNNNTNIQNKSG